MARNENQRLNVLTDIDCLLPSQRSLTETEKAEKLREPVVHSSKKKDYREPEFSGIQVHDYEESEPLNTEKDRDYPHSELQPPTHLWTETVHASDKCVQKGQRYQDKRNHGT